MASIRLTQLAVDKLAPPPAGRAYCWDRTLPGFGLRLTPNGAKTWIVSYRLDGRKVMQTLGTAARLPVDTARKLARESLAQVAAGKSPVAEKRIAQANLVEAAVAGYLAQCDRDLRPKTATEWRRIFERDVLPRWGGRTLAEISPDDVRRLVADKATTRQRKRTGAGAGAAVQAGKMLTRLRTFFGWAIAQGFIKADPAVGLRRPAKEAVRDRVLTDAEIAAFWDAAGTLGLPFGAVFRLMLLTAQRESEVGGMRWSELDLGAATWTLPSERTKNRKPHIVHLGALALEVLDTVPRVAGQDLLFSGSGKTAVSGFSRAKSRLDAAMRAALGDLAPWVLHDLRRTATTGMARLAIAPHVADKILNHTAGTIRGVAAVYNRFEYLDERKAALDAWGRFVEALVRPSSSNVVRLATAS